MEDYVVLSQTVDKQNKSVFNKVLRKSDDAIFEVGVTKNKHGVCYGIFFEGNDYRKMGIAFIKGEDIMPFRLNDAPKDEKEEEVFYFVSNSPPPLDLQQYLFKDIPNTVLTGIDAVMYKELLTHWEHDIFFYSKNKNEYCDSYKLKGETVKNFNDYKYHFKVS